MGTVIKEEAGNREIRILEGKFDTGTLANLDGSGLLQQEGPLLWRTEGQEIDLRDAEALKKRRGELRRAARYREAKQVNRILTQLDFVNGNIRADHYPEELQIEHSERCNARCIMCNHFFTRNQGCSFMEREVIRRLEGILPYVDTAALNGIGEPFLHPHIMELMSLYEKYGVRLTTNTNLSVMNPELAALIHRTFDNIQISCDGCDRATYEGIRKGLRFDTFVRHARMLREAGDTEICMAVVVMKQNLTRLPGIVELAADLGCDRVVMLDLNTSALLRNTKDGAGFYPAAASFYMEKARETAQKRGVLIHTLEYVDQIHGAKSLQEEEEELRSFPDIYDEALAEELYALYEKAGFAQPVFAAAETDYCTPSECPSEGTCVFIENRPFISAGGHVFNCCSRRMHSMGNIREQEFEEVWNGSAMQSIRRIQTKGYLPRYCVGCSTVRGSMMGGRLRLRDEESCRTGNPYDELRMDIIRKKIGASI